MGCWCNGQCPHIGEIIALTRKRQLHQAERRAEAVLLEAPYCPRVNLTVAQILTNTNRAHFAGEHFARAKTVDGDNAFLALTEANNLRAQTKISAAVDRFRESVTMDPANDNAWAGLILCLELLGQLEEARAVAGQLEEARQHRPEIRRAIAQVYASLGDHERALTFLPSTDLRPMELFERGRIFDKLARYDEAWRDWMDAKKRLRDRAGHRYQQEALGNMAQAMFDMTYAERFRLVRPLPDPNPHGEARPLFIGGFPRSGTTMIETMLTCHSRIEAGDELPFLNETITMLPRFLNARAPYPKCLDASSFGNNVSALALAREFYLTRARAKIAEDAKPGAHYFTDKMPLNELHFPLMRLLFPNSPVVYMRRHPLDIIVSSMSYFITHGYYYASDLEAAAHAYTVFDAILERYKDLWPEGLTEVRYETFCEHSHIMGLGLMSVLGLEHEAEQMQFHLNPRHSRTISHNQVRAPLYTSSVFRYKNYLAHLAPVVDILRPIIQREGYEI
jgi:tetratricopeptide (TPR) repeat protein